LNYYGCEFRLGYWFCVALCVYFVCCLNHLPLRCLPTLPALGHDSTRLVLIGILIHVGLEISGKIEISLETILWMLILIIEIIRIVTRRARRARAWACKVCACSLDKQVVLVPVATLCNLPVAQGWKSQTLRLPPKLNCPPALSVLAKPINNETNSKSFLSDSTSEPTSCSVSPQTELPEGVPIECKQNTFLVSSDYKITMPMTQPMDIHWNIETQSSIPLLVRNRFRSSKSVEQMDLSPGALQILHLPNAGGNSLESEVLSFELLHRCYGAELLETEMEIAYFPESSKKTDYSVLLHGHRVGVSVTRAMKFNALFTREDAIYLLEKKLFGIIVSSRHVLEEHGWEKQILHVWASHSYIADIITEVFHKISNTLRVDTLLILTVCTEDSKPSNIFTSNTQIHHCIFHPPP